MRDVARALGVPIAELIERRDNSVEQRLMRRFLEQLPAHQTEELLFRFMREFGEAVNFNVRRGGSFFSGTGPGTRRWRFTQTVEMPSDFAGITS